MTPTLFGCSFSELWVSPSDWKTAKSKDSLNKQWYIQCYFYDPLFKDKYPKGKPYRKKLNKLKSLEDRKVAVKMLLEEIPNLFLEGYNHITETYMKIEPDAEPEPDKLGPTMPAAIAIEDVWNKIKDAAMQSIPDEQKAKARPFDDVRVAKNRFVKALNELRYNDIPISELTITQVKETIVHAKITEGYYNKFLSYMSKLFTELIEYGCVTNNYFKLYKKVKPQKNIRETLEDEQVDDIVQYLRIINYGFYRYGMIFHQSGARSTELMMVQKKDVNLDKQEYKVLIKKGGQYCEEIKVIMQDALPFWKEIMSEAEYDDDYLFSKCLRPGPVPIAARQITRKWKKYIKDRYSEGKETPITADFYALKHYFLDKLDAMHHEGLENAAQRLASHTTNKITNSVYLVNKKKRELETLKKVSMLRVA
jgi:integrase